MIRRKDVITRIGEATPALAILIASVLLIFVYFKFNLQLFLTSCTILLASSIYLIGRRRVSNTPLNTFFLGNNNSLKIQYLTNIAIYLLVIVFIFGLLSRPNEYQRPLLCFSIPILISILISLQILFSYKSIFNQFTILNIITLALITQLSQLVLFPSPVGWDVPFHINIISNTINDHVPLFTDYSSIPDYHLLAAISSLLTNIDLRLVIYFTISTSSIVLGSLIAYLVGSRYFNEKLGLLSGLIFIISNYIVTLQLSPIPNTLAGSYILLIIFISLYLFDRNVLAFSLLSIIFIISTVLTHTVGAIALIIVYGIIAFGAYVLEKRENSSYRQHFLLFLILVIIMIGHWTLVSGHINKFTQIYQWGFDVSLLRPTSSVANLFYSQIPTYEQVLNISPIIVYVFFSVIGFYFILSQGRQSKRVLILSCIGQVFFFFPMLTQFLKLYNISYRWWFLAELLLCVNVAVGLFFIGSLFRNKLGKVCVILLCVGVFSSIMLISLPANIDNYNLFPNLGVRYANTLSELEAGYFIKTHSGEEIITTDYDYGANPSNSILINTYGIRSDRISSINSPLYTDLKNSEFIVIRKEIMNNPFRTSDGTIRMNTYTIQGLSGFNKAFDNGGVYIYNL